MRPVMPPKLTWARSGILRLASPPPWCWAGAAAPLRPGGVERRPRHRGQEYEGQERRQDPDGAPVRFVDSVHVQISSITGDITPAALRQPLPYAHLCGASQAFRALARSASPRLSFHPMPYDFDRIIDRRNTESNKWHKYPPDVLPLWVADMDFASPEPVIRALRERVEHGVFGYGVEQPEFHEVMHDRLPQALRLDGRAGGDGADATASPRASTPPAAPSRAPATAC